MKKCMGLCASVAILAFITLGVTVGATAFNRMPNCITTRITPKQLIAYSSIAVVTSVALYCCKLIGQQQEVEARYNRIFSI